MSTTMTPSWDSMRTEESRMVERELGKHFERVDAYRYNSASLRVRVLDPRFENRTREARDRAVERQIAKLPDDIQREIVAIFCFAPSEIQDPHKNFRAFTLNSEFESPSPSRL